MNKRIVTTALALATLLGVALLSGCQDVSTELKAQNTKRASLKRNSRCRPSRASFPNSTLRI